MSFSDRRTQALLPWVSSSLNKVHPLVLKVDLREVFYGPGPRPLLSLVAAILPCTDSHERFAWPACGTEARKAPERCVLFAVAQGHETT